MPVVESFMPSSRIDDLGDGAGVVCRPGSSSFFLFLFCVALSLLGVDDRGGDGEMEVEKW